jgi:hypothetical protein
MPDRTNGFEDFDLEAVPVRTDITVLPADPPDRPTLGFVVREYLGGTIYYYRPDGGVSEDPVRGLHDLQPGMQVVA